jgi:hypothetical protein
LGAGGDAMAIRLFNAEWMSVKVARIISAGLEPGSLNGSGNQASVSLMRMASVVVE